jgi:hypothetical protein
MKYVELKKIKYEGGERWNIVKHVASK